MRYIAAVVHDARAALARLEMKLHDRPAGFRHRVSLEAVARMRRSLAIDYSRRREQSVYAIAFTQQRGDDLKLDVAGEVDVSLALGLFPAEIDERLLL